MTAYKEPTGPGVRVDSCGYAGLRAAAAIRSDVRQAHLPVKLDASFASALDHTLRALDEFHIAGLTTNLQQLRAVLSHPALRAGDARTSFFSEHPELAAPTGARASASGSLVLLEQQATALHRGTAALILSGAQHASAGLVVSERRGGRREPDGWRRHRACRGEPAPTVEAGATLMIISAMKMETAITAPCAGVVTDIRPTEIGATVAAGQIIATIAPASGGRDAASPRRYGDDTWAPTACRRAGVAGDRPSPLRARFDGSGRSPPAQSRQANLPRADRPAARRRQLSRGRQPRGLRGL